MQNIFFISDVHLDYKNQNVINKFIDFLQSHSSDMKELYILGDLFEYWVDDKQGLEEYSDILNELKLIRENGTKIYFIHGNRDFLIGKIFPEFLGALILDDKYYLNIDGFEILITHGDLLCTDDLSYQRFRKFIRSRFSIFLINILSYNLKMLVANFLRKKSKKIVSQKPEYIMDVNLNTVKKYFELNDLDIIIHGHTHRINTHKVIVNNKTRYRYVLGDWHNTPSYLVYRDNTFSLKKI
tara:strand:+ start:1618 stop:2337 length:720 start_codon:yes stop_codon:yes gene_type:complete